MDALLADYGNLLAEVDGWFSRCSGRFRSAIACTSGCSECCRGLFDITLLDACYLKSGVDRLPARIRQAVTARARVSLTGLLKFWTDFDAPYLLNVRPEELWDELMPDDDETPCILLDGDGRCLVYEYRPMTCRLHGLPLIDFSGEVMYDEWCTRNFNGDNPLELGELKWEFMALFRRELALFHRFTKTLFGQSINELDTLIPTALLIDFQEFSWKSWFLENRFLFLS